MWFRQANAFLVRYFREILRNRAALFWSFGFPTAFYLLTISVFIDMDEIPAAAEPSVMAVTAIGYGVFGSIIVCLNAFGQQFAEDLEVNRYATFRSLPLRPSADLAGRTTASVLIAAVSFAFVLAVSVLTGASYSLATPSSVLVVIAAFVLSSVIWVVFALLVAVVAKNGRYVNVISLSFALAAYFGTGFNGTVPSSFAGDDVLLNYFPNSLATRMLSYHLVAIDSETAGGSPWEQAGLVPPEMPAGAASIGLLLAYAIGIAIVGLLVLQYSLYKRGEWA